MKKIIVLFLFITVQNLVQAQGINVVFSAKLNWQQIIQKAKNEGKFVFVDCYTTWCVPCKQVDEEVYTDSFISEYLNKNFVSVKIQMDSTGKDNAEIRSWRSTANQIKENYDISAYPTFLFFSSEGKLLHKYSGYTDRSDFLRQAFNATVPNQQEYYLLAKFRENRLANIEMPSLINLLERASDKKAADEVAQKYIHDYLLQLPPALLFKSENIDIMGRYLRKSDDKVFEIFLRNKIDVDRATQTGYADAVLLNIIRKEIVDPSIWIDKGKAELARSQPNWVVLYNSIEEKYGKYYADLALINPKVDYYKQTGQWTQLVQAYVEKIEKFAFDPSGQLKADWVNSVNNISYNYIFKYATDKRLLEKAVSWSKMVLTKEPNEPDYLDTYANLLYKSGDKKMAITIETLALENNRKKTVDWKNPDDSFLKKIQLMKASKPTWLE